MNISNPNLDLLLNRLEHVRPAGDSFRARCPVHQGNSRDSLIITPCDDGRILLQCHTYQCPPLEILMVCGLGLSDVIPERITHHIAPSERLKQEVAALKSDQRSKRVIRALVKHY